jgi:hypothetical protein
MFVYTQEEFIVVLIIQFICKKASLELQSIIHLPHISDTFCSSKSYEELGFSHVIYNPFC